ncbi:MAG: acyl-ACP--UDP-N-acetylglucosamine O-acyltransferase [Planctomycetota bacterium]
MARTIHKTAVVASGAELGEDVHVGPYSVIGPHVRVGDGTHIGAQVVIDGVTTIGKENRIVGQASIGGRPQDLSYEDEPTCLEIGDHNTVREFVTINRGTVKGGALTRIGSHCLFMACSHVAHDCEIADGVMLANNALLAGHVYVGTGAIINGAAAAHQFVSVGQHAYVGGMTRVIQDVPPFMILEGHPARVRKVNVIGLERSGFDREEIRELRDVFRLIYRSGQPRHRIVGQLEEQGVGGLVAMLLEELKRTELGSKGRFRETLREDFLAAGQRRMEGVAAGGAH